MSKRKKESRQALAAQPSLVDPPALPIFLALVLLALFLSFPERVYVFDGVLFAGIIERIGENWRADLFNPRHLIFNAAFMALRDALGRCGISVKAYTLIQRVNAVLGAAGAVVFFSLARRLLKSGAWALLLAFALATSLNYWSRASEGQVYMAMCFGGLLVSYLSVLVVQEPSYGAIAALDLSFALAVALHSANLFLLPMAAAAHWYARERRAQGLILAAVLCLLGALFGAVFHVHTPGELWALLSRATEFFSPGRAPTASALAARWFSDAGPSLLERLRLVVDEQFSAWLAGSSLVAAAAFFVLLLAAGALSWNGERRREARVLCAGWLGLAFLNACWRGGEFFWTLPLALALLLLALAAQSVSQAGSEAAKKRAFATAAVALLAAASWNFMRGIEPRTRIENNVPYRYTELIEEHTVPFSWVVLSGLWSPNLKPYLPYFAQRNRQALDLFLEDRTKKQALAALKSFLSQKVAHGVPLFLLSDLVDDQTTLDQIRSRWGVTLDDLRACFGPGHVDKVFDQDGLGIFVFVPNEHKDLLFANLAFAALNAPTPAKFQEVTTWLHALASDEMSRAQARRAVLDLPRSDYGFDLILYDYWPGMDADRRAAAAADRRAFLNREKSADFQSRLGDIISIAGFPDLSMAHWKAAYALSGDPRLKSVLQKLH